MQKIRYWGLLLGLLSVAAHSETIFLKCESKDDPHVQDILCDLGKDTIVNSGNEVTLNPKSQVPIIEIKAVRLGKSYTLVAGRIEDGKIVSSAKLKSQDLDEFDSIVPRLVRTVLLKGDVKNDAKVGEVTQDESQFRRTRKQASYQTMFGLGFGGISAVGAGAPSYHALLGFSVDWTSFRLRIDWEHSWIMGGGAWLMTLGVGGNIYFNESQSAPYVAPRLSYTIVQPEHTSLFDAQSAPGVGAALGWEFFRNFDHQASVEFFTDASFQKVNSSIPMVFGIRGIVYR